MTENSNNDFAIPLEKRITKSSVSPTWFELYDVLLPKPDPLPGTNLSIESSSSCMKILGLITRRFSGFLSQELPESYLTSKLQLILLIGRAGPTGSEHYSDKCFRTSMLTSRMRLGSNISAFIPSRMLPLFSISMKSRFH